MADFYRVANGNWNLANSWATTSGGTTYHAAPPTASDDVFFDASTPTGTHTLNVAGVCNNINFTGFTGTYTTANGLSAYGSVTFVSGMTANVNNYISLQGTGTHTITSSSTGFPVRIFGNGTFTMQDDFKKEFNIEGGSSATVDFNDFDFNPAAATFFQVRPGAGTPTLYLRSGTFTNTQFSFLNTNLILNAGTSTINLLVNGAGGRTFAGGGFTFNNFSLTKDPTSSAGSHTITGSNTFNQISVGTAPSTIRFRNGTTQTVSSLVANGTIGNNIILQNLNSAITNETVGTGDGSTTTFTNTLANHPITPGTLTIAVFLGVTLTDDGVGGFTGLGSGTINYTTGDFSVTFDTAPANIRAIRANYTSLNIGWTISDSTGVNSVSYCTITDSTATGGATWNAYTSNSNTDGGGNTGWIFEEPTNTGNFLAFM